VRPYRNDETDGRSARDAPLVVEHPEGPEEDERRELRRDHRRREGESSHRVEDTRCEQQYGCSEQAPELEACADSDQSAGAKDSSAARFQRGEHPEQRYQRFRRMSLDEGSVRQTSGESSEAGKQPPARRDAESSQDEEQERGDTDLDDESENFGAARGPCKEELQRAGLELPLRVDRRPLGREQHLPAVDEVEEIARVGTSVERGKAGRAGENRQPDASRRARKLPHSGRYRRQKGDG
jgi:hypothetical protein